MLRETRANKLEQASARAPAQCPHRTTLPALGAVKTLPPHMCEILFIDRRAIAGDNTQTPGSHSTGVNENAAGCGGQADMHLWIGATNNQDASFQYVLQRPAWDKCKMLLQYKYR